MCKSKCHKNIEINYPGVEKIDFAGYALFLPAFMKQYVELINPE